MNESLKVMLWGDEIGRLSWDKRRRKSYFVFNPAFLNKNWDVAPLVASVKDVRSRFPIYGEEDRKYQHLPSFLADSLPDDWGNRLFECWRKENRLSNADVTPLEKLSFIGRRGMGALEFEPEVSRFGNVRETVDMQSLVGLAQRIFLERERLVIRPEETPTLQSLIAVSTSAGGRQPKAVIAINRETGEIRSGQIGGLTGYEYCLIKFGDPDRSSAELEMTYYEMACKAGISMMESRLIEVDGKKHFLTRRFDRRGNEKLHTQTLAAIYPGADSYEKLLWVCRKMRLPETDCEEVFRRMVFNVLANNTDDHDKNFSFIMDKSGKWTLAPAYDMTFIFNTGGFQPQPDHCLMIGGKVEDLTLNDLMDFAASNGIRRPESIIKKVVEAIKLFRELARKYKVKDVWTGRINTCLQERLTAWGMGDSSGLSVESLMLDGHNVEHIRLEQAFRGNYHLLAEIDGCEIKYIIRKGTDLHVRIDRVGISALSKEFLTGLVKRYLLAKV